MAAGRKIATTIPLHEKEIISNIDSKDNASAYLLNLLRLVAMFDIEKTLKNLINFGINSVTSGSNSLDTVLNKNTIQDLENEINKSEFENFNSLDEDDLL